MDQNSNHFYVEKDIGRASKKALKDLHIVFSIVKIIPPNFY